MNVSIEHITAGYGDGPTIVKDVSLTAPQGRVTTLLGPNGCGKSTLLKAMSRLLTPTSGRVLYGEIDIHTLRAREAAQTVALLPQHPVSPPGLTVGELVERGRHPYRSRMWGATLASDKEIIRKALEQTDTAALVDRDVAELSGGQRQRVWLAMVLAQDTPAVLLDEPTTFLDPAHAIEVLTLVRQLAEQGKTVVMVLHDLTLAGMFSDQVAVMKDGQLIAEGTPRQALTEQVLAEAYGLRAEVWEDPQGAAPIIVPRSVV
ncbi:ABC transporter ATP-binding protein [Corynebacterium auriscanis]|uniref:Iron-enterobactin transporter ATP-binding protein n=1 Tax=Corynebacterium auriscanis TaxID=99807 RepID=A0A0A2DPV2_9CORY|nr:ABC transporter ATP-binding protein [Corynebacterium auriscanis]KGM18881.1 iron-enterobactin transporter ATP-binding protein [Corynebacterium auriscanis]WJY73552.1 putative siderophore transport system ATP-binding protein YusV [Corynebacterium auriscanis]